MEMEASRWMDERVARLEEEVAQAARDLERLDTQVRLTEAEIEAARDARKVGQRDSSGVPGSDRRLRWALIRGFQLGMFLGGLTFTIATMVLRGGGR